MFAFLNVFDLWVWHILFKIKNYLQYFLNFHARKLNLCQKLTNKHDLTVRKYSVSARDSRPNAAYFPIFKNLTKYSEFWMQSEYSVHLFSKLQSYTECIANAVFINEPITIHKYRPTCIWNLFCFGFSFCSTNENETRISNQRQRLAGSLDELPNPLSVLKQLNVAQLQSWVHGIISLRWNAGREKSPLMNGVWILNR